MCMQICGKERGGGRSPANVYFTPSYFSHKRHLLNRASIKHLYGVSFPHTACIVLISSRGPVHSFLWPSKDFSLPFLLCKHFLVGVRKDQVPLCFLSPFCHAIKSKILSSFLIFILITVVATKTRSLNSN